MSVLQIRERLVGRLSDTGWHLYPGLLLSQCMYKAGTRLKVLDFLFNALFSRLMLSSRVS